MLIDTHCHFPHEKYDQELDQIIKDSQNNDVKKLIVIGTSIENSKKTLEVVNKYNNLFATIGVYPHEDKNLSLSDIQKELENLYRKNKSKIVGIGECGIDLGNWEDGRNPDEQVELFKLQTGFAIEHDLPLVLHNRNGDKYIEEIFSKYAVFKGNKLRGVAHCYVGNWNFAKYLIDFGFYISFSGIITFPKVSSDLIDTIKKIPKERILVETDSPYLAPQKYRGQINYPKYVKIVAEAVAQIRNASYDEIAQITYKNAHNLFNIKYD
ncbi:hypothetical protein A2V49_00610 [candidate division WWE3 bacterium RBG_19FT_COMBO_34_6]|uniref:Hydrolase TatD n=1 Tax=candidate division WWE3 bacterium RBG_19FT_COMBO_34_6 TaxID=1802612 RepID=A0A1F4UQT6_UNCKA|nr:MAG: hypothetical protein A2V49_00610 [candidate division WWE3 bacterium RBG_19FT_COMBO_34_6]